MSHRYLRDVNDYYRTGSRCGSSRLGFWRWLKVIQQIRCLTFTFPRIRGNRWNIISTGSHDSEGLKGRNDRYLWWNSMMPGVKTGRNLTTCKGEPSSTLEWWRPQVSFSNPNKIYDQQDTCRQPLKRGGEEILGPQLSIFLFGKESMGKSGLQDAYPGNKLSRFKWEHVLSDYINCRLIMAKVEVGIVWSLNDPWLSLKKTCYAAAGVFPNVEDVGEKRGEKNHRRN